MAPINKKQIGTTLQQAIAHHQAGRLEEAKILYEGILSVSPAEPDVLLNLSTLMASRGQLGEAEALLVKLTLVHPTLAQGQFALGNVLYRLGRSEEALARFAQAVKLAPTDANAHTNHARVAFALGRHGEALPSLNFLLSKDPNNAELELERGMALEFLGDFPGAIASYERYQALKPERATLTTFTIAQHELLLGNYPRGLDLYEQRWHLAEFAHSRSFTAPLWLGDAPIGGKTILITREQGFGDTIQFARYVPLLEKLGATVILEVRAPLVTLMRSLSPTATVIAEGEPAPSYDFYCPTMSLPRAFGTTLDTIPTGVPYLAPSEEKRRQWRQVLGEKTRPRIGLVWSGSSTNFLNARRSIPLNQLAPLLDLPFEFHALQKEILLSDQLAYSVFTGQNKLLSHQHAVADFEDTAAITGEMDLVLSTCTSLSHLAGALAKPLWMLLSDRPDWRWHLGRDDSPWYPTARLFRQTARDDWSSVIEPVIEALNNQFK